MIMWPSKALHPSPHYCVTRFLGCGWGLLPVVMALPSTDFYMSGKALLEHPRLTCCGQRLGSSGAMAFWLRLRLCRLFSCLAAASLAWRLPLGRRAAAGQPGVPMPPPGKAPPMATFSHAEVLLSRRAELQSEVRRLSTKLARAKSVQRAVERRSKSLTAETTPEKHRRLILCAFWIVNCVSRDCLVLLEHVRSPPVWGSLDADGRAALVEALFLAVDLDELESWMTPESPENRMRMQELWILDAEWRTARWVFHTNSVHGVAPSSSKVVDVYRENRLLAPPEFQPRAFARSLGARRLWAMR